MKKTTKSSKAAKPRREYSEAELADVLWRCTTKGHPDYNAKFDKAIRAKQPHWFKDEPK